MKKVFIEHGSMAYTSLFKSLGFEVVYAVEAADFGCFTGGADVTPSLYGDCKHPLTGTDTYRDAKEQRLFNYFKENNIPMVGICRGGQFLNVMSGGRMYQDVTNHCGSHSLVDKETGETIYVSSTHHQMMMPSKEAEIVAVATLPSTREWYDAGVFMRDEATETAEVVYYRNTRSLCFQPHPEFNAVEFEGMKRYFEKLLYRYNIIEENVCGC